MRVEINHRWQIWDILVRFRATPKLPSVLILACENKSLAANLRHFGAILYDSKTAFGCQAALRTRTSKYWIDQIFILDTLLVYKDSSFDQFWKQKFKLWYISDFILDKREIGSSSSDFQNNRILIVATPKSDHLKEVE